MKTPILRWDIAFLISLQFIAFSSSAATRAADTQGEVHVRYWTKCSAPASGTEWTPGHEKADFIRHFRLRKLEPETAYAVKVEARLLDADTFAIEIIGGFQTTPDGEKAQKNMYPVCGNRHWQHVSVDPETDITEYSCAPTSDKHAGGRSQQNVSSMHQNLKYAE